MKARSSRPLSIVFFAATLALGASAASAQTAAPAHEHGGMPMGGGDHGGMGGGDHGDMKSMMHDMMKKMASQIGDRVAALKTELKITDAQLPQWKAFADALVSAGKSMENMGHHMAPPAAPAAAANPPGGDTSYPDAAAIKKTGPAVTHVSENLPARLDAHEKMISAHLATLQAIKAALEPLYASFSDEQKKIADGLMVGPMGVM